MDREELIAHTKQLLARTDQEHSNSSGTGIYAQAIEFLRVYAGRNNSFYETLKLYDPGNGLLRNRTVEGITQILRSFLEYTEAGLHQLISPERQAQLDVVSDFLEMAQRFLDSKDVHPASAAMLIGATLEEFLRTWTEAEGLQLGTRKPGLETYSQMLRDANLITKQDGKDITSWAGTRNHAAHGEWDEVGDRNRVRLMLEGVNLFMRKYGA